VQFNGAALEDCLTQASKSGIYDVAGHGQSYAKRKAAELIARAAFLHSNR
jgi:hypothetical protein